MRVHIYEEELGEGVEIIRKDNVNGNETFYGLRIWLKSPREILEHSTPEDDDRCAVTIWSRTLSRFLDLISDIHAELGRKHLESSPGYSTTEVQGKAG